MTEKGVLRNELPVRLPMRRATSMKALSPAVLSPHAGLQHCAGARAGRYWRNGDVQIRNREMPVKVTKPVFVRKAKPSRDLLFWRLIDEQRTSKLKYSKEHEWLRKEADGTYTLVLPNMLRSC